MEDFFSYAVERFRQIAEKMEEEKKSEPVEDQRLEHARNLIRQLVEQRNQARDEAKKWKYRAECRKRYLQELIRRHQAFRCWIASFAKADEEVLETEFWDNRADKVIGLKWNDEDKDE